MAIALQVRNAIINIPENIQNLKASIENKSAQNVEYKEQLKSSFPDKEELNKGIKRMTEIDSIILQREKEKSQSNDKANGIENQIKNSQNIVNKVEIPCKYLKY